MYYIIGYNGNVISKHRKFDSMIKKSEKIDRKLRRMNQRPAYHFESDTAKEEKKIDRYFREN